MLPIVNRERMAVIHKSISKVSFTFFVKAKDLLLIIQIDRRGKFNNV